MWAAVCDFSERGGILSHSASETQCAAFVGEVGKRDAFSPKLCETFEGRKEKQSAMVLSRGKFAFCVNRNVSEKGRNKPDLCGGHSE